MKKIFWALFIAVCIAAAPVTAFADKEHAGYQRIVSLLPSITEILFTLGQGDKVVGVTRYCKHPPEAQQKTIVGGILDTGFETVYHLDPDLILMEATARDQKEKLDKMGFTTMMLDTRSVEGILGSIRVLGDVLHCQQKAAAIIANIQGRIEYVRSQTKGLPKTRVLVTYLRPVGEGTIREVYIAGNNTYFNDLIEITGGKNVYEGPALITSPIVSAEGILRMDPDVIIEVINMLDDVNITKQQVLDDWKMLPELKAYKNNRIHVFNQPYIGIPGPRIAFAVEDFARVVHPQIDWGKSEPSR